MPPAVTRASFALIASFLFLAPLLLSTPTTEALAPPDADALGKALTYLAAKREATPPFRGTQVTTVVEGLAYANVDPRAWPSSEKNAFDLLSPYAGSNGPYYSHLRIAYAAGVSGYDPRDVHGVDYLQKVRDGYVAAQFGNVSFNNDDVWGVLALRAAGVPATDSMIQQGVQNIQAARTLDGGWSHIAIAAAGDVDSTGMALLALAHAGVDLSGDTQARTFLANLQAENGGFRPKKDLPPHCQSTVWALHGLNALGQALPNNALDFLRRLQNADGGFGPTLDTHGNPTASDTFCTAEVLAILAGTLTPRLSYAAAHIERESPIRAGAPTTLRIGALFTDVKWNVSGTHFEGNHARVTFAKPGTYPVDVDARAGNLRGRYHGTITVAGSPPTLLLEPIPATTLRHMAVAIDARTSSDLDGTLARLEIDWGDGNTSSEPRLIATHSYEAPGHRTLVVRLVDDDGLESQQTHALTVANRAPTFAPWTDGVIVSRTQGNLSLPAATDADGDTLLIRWTRGNESNSTTTFPIPREVGPVTVFVEARDPYGANASTDITFEVVNLAPTLTNLSLPAHARAGTPFAYSVDARDADGPPPAVVWRFGEQWTETPSGRMALPAGTWNVSAVATDADGASTKLSRTLVVRANDTATADDDSTAAESSEDVRQTTAPRVDNLTAAISAGVLHVAFDASPPEATRRIHWQTDDASGTANVVGRTWEMPMKNGTWARVTVELEWAGKRASTESPVLHAPPRAAPAPPTLAVTPDPATAGAPVTLSLQSDAPIRRMRIDTGDGRAVSSNTTTAIHTYDAAGTYVLSIFIEDNEGRRSQATRTLEVSASEGPTHTTASDETSQVVHLAAHENEGEPSHRQTAGDAIAAPPTPRQTPTASLALALAALGLLAIARGRPRR